MQHTICESMPGVRPTTTVHAISISSYAEEDKNGTFTLWVALADVSALVMQDSPIDLHAQINTTTVYTPAKIFPMLPKKLSTDLTSLSEGQDLLAQVVEVHVSREVM